MQLRWDDLDLAEAVLEIRRELGKTQQERRGRRVPISRHLVDELAGWPRASEHVNLIERHNVHDETTSEVDGLIRYRDDVESLDLPPKEAEDKLCEQYHHVVLRVRVADPKWLEGLQPGLVFGSASYDVWLDDPKSGDE